MSQSSENDFIEFLIFQNRWAFLDFVMNEFPDYFGEYHLGINEYGQVNFYDKENKIFEINDLIDYCLEISLNDFGREFYFEYVSGGFFNEEESGEIIENGLVLNIKYVD